MHTSVKQAIQQYTETWEKDGMDWIKWVETCEQARVLFAKVINAKTEEVAIVSSVSHAVSAIATSLQPMRNKNKVIINELDFPTIGHVWNSSKSSFDVEFLNEEELDLLPEDLLLFSTSHVNFYNGHKLNLKAAASLVHEKGGYLFVDAYQSFGQTPN